MTNLSFQPFLSFLRGACAILALAFTIFAFDAHAEKLVVLNSDNNNSNYAKGLLRLILPKTGHDYEIDPSAENSTTARVVEELNSGQLDICWFATSPDNETNMLPIRFPLYRGLLGFRVLMIHRGDQSKFDNINTLDDLKRVTLGQGFDWPDTQILEANGLNVVKVTKYDNIFYMLDGGRFDAFPRGVQEPWAEIESRPDLELTVEKHLLLSYTSPYYFFVQKNNRALAATLEKGLRAALADGSFAHYFFNDPTVKDVLQKANLKSRHIINLRNPLLPENTPVDDKQLWLDPLSL